jgi:hypothetical protein
MAKNKIVPASRPKCSSKSQQRGKLQQIEADKKQASNVYKKTNFTNKLVKAEDHIHSFLLNLKPWGTLFGLLPLLETEVTLNMANFSIALQNHKWHSPSRSNQITQPSGMIITHDKCKELVSFYLTEPQSKAKVFPRKFTKLKGLLQCIFVCVQPYSTTLFGVPFPLPTPQGAEIGSSVTCPRVSGRDRDLRAVLGNPRDKRHNRQTYSGMSTRDATKF